MECQLPGIRTPRSFSDVFTVPSAATVIVGTVLALIHGTVVRVEMVALLFLVAIWMA